jgi:hypothetical protein
MVDWSDSQVSQAVAEATRMLQGVPDRGDAYEEALAN